ncbi:MAG TPA: hypothetical protein VM935_05800 [Chitinophagaceae bacterium]|nr:hypothetical protein [Chitinophagaceae bacterium]
MKTNVYSGLFFFRGSAAKASSKISSGDMGYFNPTSYGRNSGFSFSGELQAERITRSNNIYGFGVAYENGKSKAAIDSLYSDRGREKAGGKVVLANTSFLVNPFIGHRFKAGKLQIDALLGFDWTVSIDVREMAKLTSPFEQTYKIKKANHPMDLRPRVQFNVFYHRIGFLTGYSIGTENLYFYDNPFYWNKKAYAHFWRAGLGYQLK